MRDRYDVIVVGGGVGGLVSAGLLAKAGRSVLVLEAEERPGGYARSFDSNGCTFDLADHVVMSFRPGGPFGDGLLHQILSSLRVDDLVPMVRLDPFYSVVYGRKRFVIPGDRRGHVEALSRYFPNEAKGIGELFELYDAVYREMTRMPVEFRFRDLPKLPLRFPLAFRHRKATVSELLDHYISDQALRTVHTALWAYLGPPPSRASGLAWAGMMASYAGEGAFYPLGGYQVFADALCEGVRRQGGEVVLGRRVKTIRVAQDGVAGVVTDSREEIAAPTVVASMDPRVALGPMLQGAAIPARYRRRLEQSKLSPVFYALYLEVDRDVVGEGFTHETACMLGDTEEVCHAAERGDVRGVLVTTPTITDPGRSKAGRHTVVIKGLRPAHPRFRAEPAIAHAMIDVAAQAIPHLRDGIVRAHEGTEENPWPLRELGPAYGWAILPEQLALYRLGHDTPVPGLYLAGHWSQPAAGVWGAAASAVQVTRILLGRNPHESLLPTRL